MKVLTTLDTASCSSLSLTLSRGTTEPLGPKLSSTDVWGADELRTFPKSICQVGENKPLPPKGFLGLPLGAEDLAVLTDKDIALAREGEPLTGTGCEVTEGGVVVIVGGEEGPGGGVALGVPFSD